MSGFDSLGIEGFRAYRRGFEIRGFEVSCSARSFRFIGCGWKDHVL